MQLSKQLVEIRHGFPGPLGVEEKPRLLGTARCLIVPFSRKGESFPKALDALVVAAEKGRDSTVDLVAKIGRASRLGERSRGVLDPGAVSCAIILRTLAEGAKSKLAGVP